VDLRCLIVDDNASYLQAATALLRQEGVDVVGTASTTDEAVRRARELHPDVVLVDIALGPESGFDAARRLAEDSDGTAVIMISTQDETDYADLVAGTTAAGFVSKSDLSARAIQEFLGA